MTVGEFILWFNPYNDCISKNLADVWFEEACFNMERMSKEMFMSLDDLQIYLNMYDQEKQNSK
jgi:hypothetical protein